MSVGAQQVPPYYGSCCVFSVIKTLHEGMIGDFPRTVEGRFFLIGKNVAKKCGVFLHKNVQHAVDEWWISRRVSRGGHTAFTGSGPLRGSGVFSLGFMTAPHGRYMGELATLVFGLPPRCP